MKQKMSFGAAKLVAQRAVDLLRPAMIRIEVAGSLRRHKSEIGDIEIVAIPRLGGFMEGHPLDELFYNATQAGIFELVSGKPGPDSKAKKLIFEGQQLDLFLQPDPATWGVNFTLRTGSAEWSNWLVSPRAKGGMMPPNMRSKGARLWRGDDLLETPEELDVFKAMGIPWVPPIARTKGFWHVKPADLLTKTWESLLSDLDVLIVKDSSGKEILEHPFLGLHANTDVAHALGIIDTAFEHARTVNAQIGY